MPSAASAANPARPGPRLGVERGRVIGPPSSGVADPEPERDGSPLLAGAPLAQWLEAPGAKRGAGVVVEIAEAGGLLHQHVLLDGAVGTDDEVERHRALDRL